MRNSSAVKSVPLVPSDHIPRKYPHAVGETSNITSPSKSPTPVTTTHKVSSHSKRTPSAKVLKALPKAPPFPPPAPASVPAKPNGKVRSKAKGKKEKLPPMLPAQFAEYLSREGPRPVLPMLPENPTPQQARKHGDEVLRRTYMKDHRIFYASSDYSTATESTRERMKMVCSQSVDYITTISL